MSSIGPSTRWFRTGNRKSSQLRFNEPPSIDFWADDALSGSSRLHNFDRYLLPRIYRASYLSRGGIGAERRVWYDYYLGFCWIFSSFFVRAVARRNARDARRWIGCPMGVFPLFCWSQFHRDRNGRWFAIAFAWNARGEIIANRWMELIRINGTSNVATAIMTFLLDFWHDADYNDDLGHSVSKLIDSRPPQRKKHFWLPRFIGEKILGYVRFN